MDVLCPHLFLEGFLDSFVGLVRGKAHCAVQGSSVVVMVL